MVRDRLKVLHLGRREEHLAKVMAALDRMQTERDQLRAQVQRSGFELLTQVARAETAQKITAEERIGFGATIDQLRRDLAEALEALGPLVVSDERTPEHFHRASAVLSKHASTRASGERAK